MRYEYECKNIKCKTGIVVINKPMKDSSNIEYCNECGKELTRSYSVGIQTADGFKR